LSIASSYWDPTANNWAFDYDSYYAAYGQTNANNANIDNATYVQQALQQASAYGQEGAGGFSQYPQGSGANGGAAGSTDKKKKVVAGPKDANGNAVAGILRRGQTRETVLRTSVGKLYEDQTLLEWDPGELQRKRSRFFSRRLTRIFFPFSSLLQLTRGSS
jgi:hypothetical protein